MRMVKIFRLRLRSLFSCDQVAQELDQELRYHLERQIEEEVAAGKTPEEARFAALRSIRDVEQRKEECRDMRSLNLLDSTIQDFRYTFRQLRKNPGFACTAIFVLALGIAVTVTMFSFANAALIKPLPHRDQSQLVAVFESSLTETRNPVSYLNFTDWKRLNTVFGSIGAYALNGSFTLTTRGSAQQVPGTRVSADFFRTLGVAPVLGRDFSENADSPAAPHTVIITYKTWQKQFGGNQDVLGRTILLNGAPTSIIGVLPSDFQFAPYAGAQFWGNLREIGGCEQNRGCSNLITIAWLKNGVSLERAAANMRSIARYLQTQYPNSNGVAPSANLVPLKDLIVGDVRPTLLALLSGAVLVLLIALVNVTTLLLARSDKRRQEMAMRSALGASPARLFRQFAIEGCVLAALGGCFGLLLAGAGLHALVSLVPANKVDSMPFLRGIGLTPLTILAGCCISLLAAVLFAVVPAMRASISNMMESLKQGSRGHAGTTWRRLGSNLVIVEIAVAMVLLVGAGLLGRSLYLLLHVNLGFKPDHLAVVQTSWDPGRYDTDREMVLGHRILERISHLPGVQSVALSNAPPVDSAWGTSLFHVPGRPNDKELNGVEVIDRHVSWAYFKTLRARLVRGRYFREDENASQPPVVIVNRTFAKTYFTGENPVGKLVYCNCRPKSPLQIVGVVDDIKEGALAGKSWPVAYVPQQQTPWAWPAVIVRTLQDPASLLPEMTQAIHRIDPLISVSEQQTMMQRIDQSPAAYLHSSSAVLVGLFAGLAFLLSVIGLYGVIAYSVSQRTREIGVRMALGAERNTVYRLILGEAGRLVCIGIGAGLACSLAAATLMRSLLFGVRPWDVPTLAAVAVALGSAALVASYIPARRAASVNPVEALRAE